MPDLRVLIVAADALARAGIAALLRDRSGYTVAGRLSGEDGLPADDLAGADAVIWDLGQDPEPALERVSDLRDAGVPIIALVADEASAGEALAAGARAVLPRTLDAASLTAAIAAVRRGLIVLDPEITAGTWRARERSVPVPVEALTPRELEVLWLLAEGLSNKVIAGRLGISEHTAKYHVNAILGKLGAQTRTEAVARAARLGLILF
jgi:two-component system nitrate/nitrite response regulator NarL